jgi:hypothetical protein
VLASALMWCLGPCAARPTWSASASTSRYMAEDIPAGPKHTVCLHHPAQSAARLKMHGLAYVEASSPLPGASYSVDGQVRLALACHCCGICEDGTAPAVVWSQRWCIKQGLLSPHCQLSTSSLQITLQPQLVLHQAAPLSRATYTNAYNSPLLAAQPAASAGATQVCASRHRSEDWNWCCALIVRKGKHLTNTTP